MRRSLVPGSLLLAACAGSAAPPPPAPDLPSAAALARAAGSASASPAVAPSIAPAVASSTLGAGAATDVAASEPQRIGVSDTAPPAPAVNPQVSIEPVYSALGHPKLATEMMTLERDDELFRWSLGGSSKPDAVSNRPGYHPATRVVVELELLSRAPKGTTKKLLRIARSGGYWAFRGCFESAQRVAQKRERASKLRLTLGAHGKVLGARQLGPASAGSEREYARCILERARSLNFAPGASRKVDIELSVKLWPGDAPVPPRAPDSESAPAGARAAAGVLGALTPALVDCYGAGLARDPGLWGRLALRVSFGPAGEPTSSEPVEALFPDPETTDCARQALAGARLPSLAGTSVTLALRFGQPPAPPPPVEAGTPPAPSPPAPGAPPALPEPPAH